MSSSNCLLTCIQISQEAGKVVWYSHLFKNVPQFVVIHIVKGFGVVNKAEVDVFLELSYFFCDPMDVCSLISASSAFSKSILNILKFSIHIPLNPGLENFEHYFAGDLGSIPGLGRFPWRREWLPTPVFWPGEFHRLNSPWCHKESDMTEQLSVSLCKRVRWVQLCSSLNILWHCLSLGLEWKLTFSISDSFHIGLTF